MGLQDHWTGALVALTVLALQAYRVVASGRRRAEVPMRTTMWNLQLNLHLKMGVLILLPLLVSFLADRFR